MLWIPIRPQYPALLQQFELEFSLAVPGNIVRIVHSGESGNEISLISSPLPEVDDPRSEMLAHFWVGNAALNHLGDLAMSERHIGQSIAAAERLRHHFYLGRSLNQMSWLLYRQGEWQASRDFNDRGLAESPRETRLLHTRVMLEYEVSDFSEGDVYLNRLLDVMRLSAPGV